MRILYVMDPLESMLPTKDTTFAFMRAAQKREHTNLHCLLRDLRVENGRVLATARAATVQAEPPFTHAGDVEEIALDEVEAVLIRKDPPFDVNYLRATQILDLATSSTFVMNSPGALRDADEKLFALQFGKWMPRTWVTSSPATISEILKELGETAVIKPIGRAGGFGVMKLQDSDTNVPAITELLTQEGSVHVMVQEYLPEVREGDKRVLVLGGRAMGAIRRIPQATDMRANIHVGGRVEACDLTLREQDLVDDIGPRLLEAGLYFVGLDLIGERLTEVNVTSPTGIQELGRLTGTTPEDDFMTWLEERVG